MTSSVLTCQRLLLACTSRLNLLAPKRWQHDTEVSKIDQALPSNLVLFGTSKVAFEKPPPLEEVAPPGDDVPLLRTCSSKIPRHKRAMKVWVDDLNDAHAQYQQAAELHPLIFGVHPRMDIIHQVVQWQKVYREVDYAWARTRAEMGRGKKKPWPQKGTGRARHGSRTAPQWHRGGICHGPRGPRSLFYQLSDDVLVTGLTIALSIKLIQKDLIIVGNHELAEPDPDCLAEFVENRALSDNTLLFIHPEKNYPENLGHVLAEARTSSLMPFYALNVYSILKYDKLILPVSVLDNLETKLTWSMVRYPWLGQPHNFYKDLPGQKALKEEHNMLLQSQPTDDNTRSYAV